MTFPDSLKYILAATFLVCGNSYCWSLNDLGLQAQQAAGAVANHASSGHLDNYHAIEGLAGEPKVKNKEIDGSITAQYGDFKWGMTMAEAMVMLKAKIVQSDFSQGACLVPFPSGTDYIDCHLMSFPDKLFDINVYVSLSFTPITRKLYSIKISELPTQNFRDEESQIVIKALDKKYGRHRDEGETCFLWGNEQKGDRIRISSEGSGDGYSISYFNSDMIALAKHEAAAQQDDAKQELSYEVASKL